MLAIDFIMRLLVIEKKVAAGYDDTAQPGAANSREHGTRENEGEDQDANEEATLLPKKKEVEYQIPQG